MVLVYSHDRLIYIILKNWRKKSPGLFTFGTGTERLVRAFLAGDQRYGKMSDKNVHLKKSANLLNSFCPNVNLEVYGVMG